MILFVMNANSIPIEAEGLHAIPALCLLKPRVHTKTNFWIEI